MRLPAGRYYVGYPGGGQYWGTASAPFAGRQLDFPLQSPDPAEHAVGAGAGLCGRCAPSPAGAVPIETEKEQPMAVASMRELLEAGVHFGHQTRRWNPKMRRFIFTERSGIYIIDLTQTSERLEEAAQFVRNLAERNGTVLFVGTKKQAQDAVENEAKRVNMPYVNHRWLGGLLTNWRTMSDRIERLHEMRRLRDEGQMDLLPAKERIAMAGELEKLEANLGGVADMRKQPDAVFIIDLKKEALAVREARRLGLPVIALVDTNCDPDEADYVVPGNDDAIRACALITRVIADSIAEGQQKVSPKDFQPTRQENGSAPVQADRRGRRRRNGRRRPPLRFGAPEADAAESSLTSRGRARAPSRCSCAEEPAPRREPETRPGHVPVAETTELEQ